MDEIKVRSMCRPVNVFHTKQGEPFLYDAGFVQGDGKGQAQSADTAEEHCYLKQNSML